MLTPLHIDHVTVAGHDLEALRQSFATAGLPTVYGGPHSNGVTHMALASFADGSYLELIASMKPAVRSPWWHDHIAQDAGPCAWCVGCADVAAEAQRLRNLDVPVRGPIRMGRKRPDGTPVAWELAFVGEGEAGATLPFLIHDHTPRRRRVPEASCLTGAGAPRGVAGVVLGVPDLERGIDLFRRVYDWPEPESGVAAGWEDAHLARFVGTPVTLAAPRDAKSWLARRLAQFGPCPCAFLLAVSELPRELNKVADWLGDAVVWAKRDQLNGARIGWQVEP